MPDGGNAVSMTVAVVQHRLVMAWLERSTHGAGAQTAARMSLSPSTWSRIITGQRWAGSVGMAGLLDGPSAPPALRVCDGGDG